MLMLLKGKLLASFVGKMTPTKLLAGVLVAVILASVSGYYVMKSQITTLQENNIQYAEDLALTQAALESATTAINEMTAQMQQMAADNQQIQQQAAEVEQEKREVIERLRKAEGRQEVVFQKPGLVERMINKDYAEFSDRISCNTGAMEKCEE